MDLFEYQARDLFEAHGVPVLRGIVARTPGEAARLGVHLGAATADWPAIRDRIFGRIDPISAGGEAYRAHAPNVTLRRSTGRFVAPKTLEVDGESLTADQFVIAAGSRPTIPAIDGLADAFAAGRAHTSDTIMRLDELPKSLVILGSGFIAAEFAHVFSALGVEVTQIQRSATVLSKEEAEEIKKKLVEAGAEVEVK